MRTPLPTSTSRVIQQGEGLQIRRGGQGEGHGEREADQGPRMQPLRAAGSPPRQHNAQISLSAVAVYHRNWLSGAPTDDEAGGSRGVHGSRRRGINQRSGASPWSPLIGRERTLSELEREPERKATTRKMSLTKDGHAFLPRARRILEEAPDGRDELAERHGELKGPLSSRTESKLSPKSNPPLDSRRHRLSRIALARFRRTRRASSLLPLKRGTRDGCLLLDPRVERIIEEQI